MNSQLSGYFKNVRCWSQFSMMLCMQRTSEIDGSIIFHSSNQPYVRIANHKSCRKKSIQSRNSIAKCSIRWISHSMAATTNTNTNTSIKYWLVVHRFYIYKIDTPQRIMMCKVLGMHVFPWNLHSPSLDLCIKHTIHTFIYVESIWKPEERPPHREHG